MLSAPVSVPSHLKSEISNLKSIQLLRLLTCGSVDDGKSTLIGRLLFDSRALFADQLDAIEKASKRRGEQQIDLSLLTDGLRWEREQGITIDVAYRYFTTANRRFILIDSPGHAQYTRNMVTGASNADATVILVDVRHGVQEQTHRHAVLAALLGIRTLIVAVNKMDLVNWSEAAFNSVREAFEKIRPELAAAGDVNIAYVPVSALKGDNIVNRSTSAPWYTGPAILDLLESAPTGTHDASAPARFPVQCVIRPRTKASDGHDFRGYAGMVASGSFKVGDRVTAASTGRSSTIESIHLHDKTPPLTECRAAQSVIITLADDLDIGRGEMLVHNKGGSDVPEPIREFDATIVWMSPTKLATGRKYLLRHSTHFTPAVVAAIHSRLDVHTLASVPATEARELECNDIARVSIRTAAPLLADPYRRCRATGSFVLIDEGSGDTVGAGMISDTAERSS